MENIGIFYVIKEYVMLNFAIIDDDVRIVKNLSHMLESIFIKHDFDANISCQTSNIDELFLHLQNHKIDVLFLDINLKSHLTGMEIAEKIRQYNKDCYFIFSSAYIEYGLVTFKYKTFDFIAKPVGAERLEECIVRLFEDINGSTKRFIKLDNKNTIIDEKEINYVQRDGMKLVFHTKSRDYEIYSSFNKIQNKLPQNFVRCHKSFIANINNITKIEPSSNIIYFGNSFCDIGPKYKNKFMEAINAHGIF
jgi:two-component system response regulator AgrA